MPSHGGEPDIMRVEREEQARALLTRISTLPPGDPSRERAREDLLTLHQGIVRYIAGRYKDRGEPFEDLMQIGMIGLLGAIEDYDPERGTQFGTYAFDRITQQIRQHFRDATWPVRVSRLTQQRIAAINQFIDERTSQVGHSPTASEVAEALDLSREQVVEALDADIARQALPIDAPSGVALTADLGRVDSELELLADRDVVRTTFATMPTAERDALLLTTVDGLTQAAAAERLGVSQMQVCRLRNRAQQRLRAAGDG